MFYLFLQSVSEEIASWAVLHRTKWCVFG